MREGTLASHRSGCPAVPSPCSQPSASPCLPADLAPHIQAAIAFISAARARGAGVLVHCYAGQSRSAALLIAYLMASRGMSLMEAWAATRAARPCAQPNAGGCSAASRGVGAPAVDAGRHACRLAPLAALLAGARERLLQPWRQCCVGSQACSLEGRLQQQASWT